MEAVPPSDLAALTGDAQEILPRIRGLDLDEADMTRRPRKLPEDSENETSQAVDFDGPFQSAIDVPEKRTPGGQDLSWHRADARPSGL